MHDIYFEDVVLRYKQFGWTLFEVVITLAVFVTLLNVAMPVYRSFVLQAHRKHAQLALAAISVKLENYSFKNNSYLGAKIESLLTGLETPSYHFKLTSQRQYYLLEAIPIDNQSYDRCGRMSLDSEGNQLSEKKGCWS